MKVLQVSTHVNIGGIGSYILSLSQTLRKNGVEVIVASSGGNLEKEFQASAISHRHLDMNTKNELGLKVIWSAFRISRIVKDEKIDIIHAHSRVSQAAAFLASRMSGVPYITTCHGYFKKRLRGIFDTWGAKVIAISDAVKAHLRDDLDVNEDRIRLVYNGVDTDRFSRSYSADELGTIRRSIGLRGGKVIGTIGRLSPVKGQKFLVEAMADLVTHVSDIEAVIVGDGPEGETLMDLASSLGIRDKVHFITSCVDTHKYLSIMDIFVFPSIKEGLGLALLEALAAGKACIASNVGGIADIIEDGQSGVLVEPCEWRGIADAVLRLMSDDGFKESLGASGRALVKSRFDIDHMAEGIVQVYNEALGSR